MSPDTPWLSAPRSSVWRGWLRLNAELSATLQRELQDDAGLSMPDFEVLVHLTDSPEGRVRVSDLARLLHWERSRVSHHVTRMERRGLVRAHGVRRGRPRSLHRDHPGGPCRDRAGRPGHVSAVRRLMFDALSDDEVDCLAHTIDKLLDQHQKPSTPSAATQNR